MTLADLESLRVLLARTLRGRGAWFVATGSSWRRILRVEDDAGVVVPTIARDGHPDLCADLVDLDGIVALHNAAEELLAAAEPTLLLAEIRRRTGDAWCYVEPTMAGPWRVRKADGYNDGCGPVVGSGATEIEALRNALARCPTPRPG